MVFQGRNTALAPIYLLLDDFTSADPALALAQDPALDVGRFAWAPDGTVGAGLLGDVVVSIELGADKRPLGAGASALTFGDTASTLYAVRVTQDGDNDVAMILAIDFLTGDTTELTSASYPRPGPTESEPLADAQLADDGGPVRLFWMDTDVLRLVVLGAGVWTIDPATAELTAMDAAATGPILWAPDGERRAAVDFAEGVTTIRVLDEREEELASTTVSGLVSHLRWSPTGARVVFTRGTSAPNGGVLQDLFLWDLNDQPPMQLTNTGRSFGAEWRGSQPLWRD
jgi:hypothetical protein